MNNPSRGRSSDSPDVVRLRSSLSQGNDKNLGHAPPPLELKKSTLKQLVLQSAYTRPTNTNTSTISRTKPKPPLG